MSTHSSTGPSHHRLLLRVARAATGLIAVSAVALGISVPSASAMDGRVPDGRAVSAVGEITAQYWHGVNRDPDAGGLDSYMSFANKNCRWGVLDASFKILNSAEAHNTWRNDPQTLAGMLYASLLNRAADPGGLATYTAAVRDRGLPWATAAMMSSGEYHARLNRICTNGNETATMYDWQSAQTLTRDVFIKNAENLAISCGFNTGLRQGLAALKSTPFPPAIALGRIAWVTNQVISQAGLDGTCGAVVTYLRAAYRVNEVIAGDSDKPVFVQWSVGKPSGISRQRPFTIRVGSNPTSWDGYSGKAW